MLFVSLVAAAAATCFSAIGSGRTFAVRLKIEFGPFNFSARQCHLRIVKFILLIFLYCCAGSDRDNRDREDAQEGTATRNPLLFHVRRIFFEVWM